MYIFEVGTFDLVQIKCKLPEFTHTKRNIPTTYSTKYWIWIHVDRDDPRCLSHKRACPCPFTPEWEYCKKYNFKSLTELKEHQVKVKGLEEEQILSSTETNPTSKSRTGQPSKRRTNNRGKSPDTQQSDVQVDTQAGDGSDIARKVLRQLYAQSNVTVLSTMGEGEETSSEPVRPIGRTLNE